jgi:hypothetical protein
MSPPSTVDRIIKDAMPGQGSSLTRLELSPITNKHAATPIGQQRRWLTSHLFSGATLDYFLVSFSGDADNVNRDPVDAHPRH